MSKNIVICCDGTGNEIEGNLSNVLKLFRIVRKSESQRVYYSPGIGSIGDHDPWTRIKQDSKAVFSLATGYGLDADILNPYRFVCEHFQEGDSIFLFGFSRGAYTVRALAGFIHMVGLLPPDQLSVADYALTSYKRAGEENDLSVAWNFSRIMGGRRASIKFLGVWDTVASVLVPRGDRIVPTLLMLPYTRLNPSVAVFRHAMAIDERRRMFRLNRWISAQPFVANPFDALDRYQAQDVKQAWFAGVHADVGGGYPETESGVAKYPLSWMVDEASALGLLIDQEMRDHLVFGKPRPGGKNTYVAPDARAELHNSLTAAWKPLEWLPKSVRWSEWPRWKFWGYYFPCGERRLIADPKIRPLIHQSAVDRMRVMPDYKPVNFPDAFDVEPYGH